MTLVWAPGFNGITDPDAQTYLAAVETADGQAIEGDVALAINDFVVGCKLDGIWDAIKASCILAGARTLSGALVPLKGTAPTNNNFVSGDYDRETGLLGNGSTKYLDSNRLNTADPTDNQHLAVYDSSFASNLNGTRIGALGSLGSSSQHNYIDRFSSYRLASRGAANSSTGNLTDPFLGFSRNSSANFTVRIRDVSSLITGVSTATTAAGSYFVFNRSGGNYFYNGRLSFYSIGEAIDLEKLDTRVTRLMHLITYTQTSGLPGLSTMDLDAASYIGGAYRAGATLS
jgi:hypothetical protein